MKQRGQEPETSTEELKQFGHIKKERVDWRWGAEKEDTGALSKKMKGKEDRRQRVISSDMVN